MIFVGRRRELEHLTGALERRRNVLVSGPYGSGRSTLLHQLGRRSPERFRCAFADFAETPAVICRALGSLLAEGEAVAHGRWPPAASRGTYRQLVAQLAHTRFPAAPLRVGVLDGLVKLTSPKLSLLRELTGNRTALWVVIAERFLPRRDLVRICGWLHPMERLRLGRLSQADVCEYFRQLRERHELPWSDDEVLALARSSGGYPLEMQRVGRRARRAAVGSTKGRPM